MQVQRELGKVLRERGLRVTQQRVAVLEFLVGARAHPTAEEIGTGVNRADAVTSRASVYNVLRSLTRAGLVTELVLDDAVARYDANLEPHHHFLCTECGRLDDVPEPLCPTPLAARFADGRLVTSVSVTLRGLCACCASARS
jgi:Fur family peroxide stress response transcriptional regulator